MPEWSNGPHSKCGKRVTLLPGFESLSFRFKTQGFRLEFFASIQCFSPWRVVPPCSTRAGLGANPCLSASKSSRLRSWTFLFLGQCPSAQNKTDRGPELGNSVPPFYIWNNCLQRIILEGIEHGREIALAGVWQQGDNLLALVLGTLGDGESACDGSTR